MSISLDDARARIGDAVVYRNGGAVEQGYITSVNDRFVFVRYARSNNGVATYPDDLEWLVSTGELA